MRKRPKISEYQFDKWAEQLKGWIRESVSPFEDDTPEKQAERKLRGKFDKLYFFKTYLPHYFTKPFGDFHEEWSEFGDLTDEAAFIAAPREYAKSTFFTFGDPIHDLCYELRHFIIIMSDTNDQATGFSLPIRLEFEDNPRIRHDFGDLCGPSWSEGDFITGTGIRVLARGKKDKVRGVKNRQWRPDKIIVDDFENDENVGNPKLIDKGKRKLEGAVIGSAGEGFCFLMVGNLFHPQSILSQFIAAKDEDGTPLYRSKVYRAILDPGMPDERSLWPALWPLDRLRKKRRTMGSRSFNAEMMNLIVVEGGAFQEPWFVYYTRADIDITLLGVTGFADPSGKAGESNDYKAVITVGLDRSAMIFYCLHARIRHDSIGEFFGACYRQVDEYGGPMGIEDNMFEDFLHEAIANYAKERRRYLAWKPVHHSTNKEQRIIDTLSYLVEYGKLQFEKGHSDQDLLVEQLIYLENKNMNDDGPDALEGAVSMSQAAAGIIEYETVTSRRFAAMKGAY